MQPRRTREPCARRWQGPHDDRTWLSLFPIAHRGLYSPSDGRPENSLPAFEEACRRGYPIELDTQLTADEEIVVIHDEHLGRLTGRDGAVQHLASHEITKLRLADTEHRIPLLTDVLELVDGRVPILIETKNPGVGSALDTKIIEQTTSYSGIIAIQSFNPLSVLRLRRATRDRLVGQISGRLPKATPIVRMIGRSLAANFVTKPDFVSYELAGLPSRAVDFWRRRGVIVIAWPVRSRVDEEHATRFADNFAFAGYTPSRPSMLAET